MEKSPLLLRPHFSPTQDPNLPELNPVARNHVYRQMAITLSRLHSVNPSAAGLDSFGSASNYCSRQVNSMQRP